MLKVWKAVPDQPTKKAVGNWGEEQAVQFLIDAGYQVLQRNFRAERGEIDVVAKQDQTLVFVEVKTSRSQRLGSPESRVDARKQAQIGKIAAAYLEQHQIEDMDCRFDVIGVRKFKSKISINHYKDAFWL